MSFDEATRKAYGAVLANALCLLVHSAINHRI
jgi:hypothetical protein